MTEVDFANTGASIAPVEIEKRNEEALTEQNDNPKLGLDETEPKAAPAPPLILVTQPAPDDKAAAKAAAVQKKRDESAEESPFSVSVGQVYDGPLDLLLDLIRKQDIDIYDITIAKITAQFLGYVNQLKATDVDVAGEFIYTASLLIHIKSRMLLPRAGAGPEELPQLQERRSPAAKDPQRQWQVGEEGASLSPTTPQHNDSTDTVNKPTHPYDRFHGTPGGGVLGSS